MLAEREPETWPVPPPAAACAEVFGSDGPEYASKYYRARYYDPKIGRFISEDPIGFAAGPNFYAYVDGNPAGKADPFGLESGATFNAQWRMETGRQAPTIDVAAVGNKLLGYLLVGTLVPTRFVDSLLPDHYRDNWFDRALDSVSPTEEMFIGVIGSLERPGPSFCLGSGKSATRWANQIAKRGWTTEMIEEALTKGESFTAPNMITPGNPAMRYVHPTTGQSLVIDTVTREVLHVGGPGFRY